MNNSGPQAWAGMGDKGPQLWKTAKFLKKKILCYKNMELDDIISDIINIAGEYKNRDIPFVAARGFVLTYYTNSIGEKDVKISIDTVAL